MRYFQYPNQRKSQEQMTKNFHLAAEGHLKAYRKGRIVDYLTIFMFIFVFALGIICTQWIAKEIFPTCETTFEKILNVLFTALAWIAGVVLTCILASISCVLPSKLFGRSRVEQKHPKFNGAACSHLRAYYGIKEPYLITKCYEASDKRFTKKDICLYFAGGELRITADLVNGFQKAYKDIGCYAMTADELAVRSVPYENRYATELVAGDTHFLLGSRARKFIKIHSEQQ